MQTLGLKEIQRNPAVLVHSIDHEDYTIITKRGHPLGVTVSFDSHILDGGLRESISLKAFEMGMISMGKLSQLLKLSKSETMALLDRLAIPVTDYQLADELVVLDRL